MPYSNLSVYKKTSINTASSLDLVVMLYQGAIRFVRQAKESIEKKDLAGKAVAIDRAVAIIHHLQGTLDFEGGGKVSLDLDRLYAYIGSRIFEGSAKLDVAALDESLRLLTTLHSAWEEIARTNAKNDVPAGLLDKSASGERFGLHA